MIEQERKKILDLEYKKLIMRTVNNNIDLLYKSRFSDDLIEILKEYILAETLIEEYKEKISRYTESEIIDIGKIVLDKAFDDIILKNDERITVHSISEKEIEQLIDIEKMSENSFEEVKTDLLNSISFCITKR